MWTGIDGDLPLTSERYRAALDRVETQMTTFATVAGAVRDWEAPVAACPGWDAMDLVKHLGQIHSWVEIALEADDRPLAPPVPSRLREPATWYRDRAESLLTALRRRRPDEAAWTLWAPNVTAFWARRQFHEVTIHLFDLVAASTGGGWLNIEDEEALDGIVEVLDGFYPRQIRLERTAPLPGLVRFDVAVGGEVRTVWSAKPESNDAPILGAVDGSASELYLALWNRGRYPSAKPAGLAGWLAAAKLAP